MRVSASSAIHLGPRGRSSVYESNKLAKKKATASPRAGSTATPVKKNSIHSRKGQTGTAGAGLKSPGTYQ